MRTAYRTCPFCEATCGLEVTLDGTDVVYLDKVGDRMAAAIGEQDDRQSVAGDLDGAGGDGVHANAVRRQFQRAQALTFPQGHPQEREVGFVWFLNRYGPALVDRLLDELPLAMVTHHVQTI